MSQKSNCAIAVIGIDIGNRKTAAECLNYSIRLHVSYGSN